MLLLSRLMIGSVDHVGYTPAPFVPLSYRLSLHFFGENESRIVKLELSLLTSVSH